MKVKFRVFGISFVFMAKRFLLISRQDYLEAKKIAWEAQDASEVQRLEDRARHTMKKYPMIWRPKKWIPVR